MSHDTTHQPDPIAPDTSGQQLNIGRWAPALGLLGLIKLDRCSDCLVRAINECDGITPYAVHTAEGWGRLMLSQPWTPRVVLEDFL
jgi:hypothetical protein